VEFELLKAKSRPPDTTGRYFIGEKCAYFSNGVVWLNCLIDYVDSDNELVIQINGERPHPQHWLSYVLEDCSLEELAEFEGIGEQFEWMMRNGVVPYQAFLLKLEFYAGPNDDGWEVTYSIKDREPISDSEASKAILELLLDRTRALWADRSAVVDIFMADCGVIIQ